MQEVTAEYKATQLHSHTNSKRKESHSLHALNSIANAAMVSSERILAPVAVLGLHLLLLANVAFHRSHLLTPFTSPHVVRALAEWSLALLALVAYLRTVCRDPGILTEPTERPDSAAAREVARATEAELQPIGRAQLEAMAEDVEDPGEEIISLEDLGGEMNEVIAMPEAMPKLEEPSAPSARRRHPWQEQHMQSGAKLRFCKACQMHQPLRTKHCRDCEQCIRTHDHHCPWVGTCVGEGNRVYFFWFLIFQWLELAVFLFESCMTFREKGLVPSMWLVRAPLLLVGIGVKCLLLLMVTCLVCFHSYLALANITTWENMSWHNISYLKGLDPEHGSPFSQSLSFNLAVYFCSKSAIRRGSVKETEDGWILWELGEQHDPLEYICCKICSCFDEE
ncbi:Palmitoyltransferase ZDHHC12-A (Zinc finger DHHC domain-containing protein 12-A) [Durusdinium trenchii]|uniref:Palmitoyltransferase n=1 Tax=Durusdinium trenchii TaxID=1381693 RepID=A0ABP0HV97_9DINO